MTIDWGERELTKEVAITFLFFFCYFEQAHFVFVSGLLFDLYGKLLVVFEKAKTIAVCFLIYILFSSHLEF